MGRGQRLSKEDIVTSVCPYCDKEGRAGIDLWHIWDDSLGKVILVCQKCIKAGYPKRDGTLLLKNLLKTSNSTPMTSTGKGGKKKR